MNTLIRIDDVVINLAAVTNMTIYDDATEAISVTIVFIGGGVMTMKGEQADRFLNAVERRTWVG
jgi:hypothetical protein